MYSIETYTYTERTIKDLVCKRDNLNVRIKLTY